MCKEMKTELSDVIVPGRYVVSLAGRDAGRVHIVVSLNGEYAYIADGRCRTVGKPKKKKCRHLKPLDVPEYTGVQSDEAIAGSIKSAVSMLPKNEESSFN